MKIHPTTVGSFPGKLTVNSIIAMGLVWSLAASRAYAQATTQPDTNSQDTTELRGEVNQLKEELKQVEAEQQSALAIPSNLPNTSQSAANAFRLTSGYDPAVGFVIRSQDGQFSLHPGFVVDFRYMANYRTENLPNNGSEVPTPGDSWQDGFDVTRLRMTFDGRVTNQFTYFIQFQDDQGTAFGLLDAYGIYHFGNSPFGLKVGQFKDPIWHERNLNEADLLAVDRSLVESLLGGGQTARVQGIALMYDQDRLRGQLVFHDGFNSGNTKFFNDGGLGAGVGAGAGVTPTDFGSSVRGEYMLIGNRTPQFNPYTEYDKQFTALNDKQNILVAGGGADFSQAGANDVLFHSADLQYDSTCGFSAYTAYYASYRDLKTNQGVKPGFYYDPGFLVQFAYLVLPKIEPFIRYDYTYLPLGSTSSLLTGEVQEFTIGANYYLYNQNLKVTLDASWLPNGAPSDADALGILKDSGHNQTVIRLQFQLAI
jgi:hypothetical protein